MQREARKTHHSADGVDYWLERKAVKNVNLRIHADGSVHVSAPAHVSQARIDAFVASKSRWIAQRQASFEARAAEAPRAWCTGEQIRLWGETLELRMERASSTRTESVTREGTELVLRVADRWSDSSEASAAHREKLVTRWLNEQLSAALPDLFARHETQMGVHAGAIRLRRMKTRWGSCKVAAAVITLNTELVHYPPCCLESVVVHELCHLIEPSHNARFHALQDRYYPAWREARKLLNARPPVG